jgi:hypothetical protein
MSHSDRFDKPMRCTLSVLWHINEMQDLLPQLFFSLSCVGGEHTDLCRVDAKGLGGLPPDLGDLIFRELIRLCQYNKSRHREVSQPLDEGEVQGRGAYPGIDDDHHATKGFSRSAIILYQRAPALAHLLGDLGISVARQIHQAQGAIDEIEIYGLSLARGGTGAGQPLAIYQSINERGFPHIGSAGKGHLGIAGRGVVILGIDALEKFRARNFHGLENNFLSSHPETL